MTLGFRCRDLPGTSVRVQGPRLGCRDLPATWVRVQGPPWDLGPRLGVDIGNPNGLRGLDGIIWVENRYMAVF